MVEWREGAAAAMRPVAQPAGEADPDRRLLQIKAIGIDHIGGMGDVATHGDDMDRFRL